MLLKASIVLLLATGVSVMAFRIEESGHFAGNVTFGGDVQLPDESITDAEISDLAQIQTSKMHSLQKVLIKQGYPATTVIDEESLIYLPHAEANIRRFYLAVAVACIGDSTIVCHLEKNGTPIANSTITIDNSIAANEYVLAPLAASVPVTADDRIEVVIDATVGTGTLGKGLHGLLLVEENAF